MKFLNSFLVFSLFTLFFSACTKDKQPAPVNVVQSVQTLSTYPFNIGNEWEYAVETFFTEGPDTTINNYTKKYTHIADTTINGELCHKMQIAQYNMADSLIYTSYAYYTNRSDGLYSVANYGSSGGFMFFKKNKYFEMLRKHLDWEGTYEKVDSVFISPAPLHLTKLPLVYSQSWLSNEYGPQFGWQRKWINQTSIIVLAGSYNCEKLQVIPNPPSSTFLIYQYYSNKGLTKVETQDSLIFGGGQTGIMRTKAELVNVNF